LDTHYTASGGTQQKTQFPSLQLNKSSIVAYIFVTMGTFVPSRCLAMNVYSGSVIPAFMHHVTILSFHLSFGLPGGLYLFRFPTKNLYAFLFFPVHAACPAHLMVIDLIVLIISGEEYKLQTCHIRYYM
jgi:hypothetical protein